MEQSRETVAIWRRRTPLAKTLLVSPPTELAPIRPEAGTTWLWSRRFDTACIACAGFFLLAAGCFLLPVAKGLNAVFASLTIFITYPHYAATYQVIVRERKIRPGSFFHLLWSAPLMAGLVAPIDRRMILLGKNLAMLPVGLGLGLVAIILLIAGMIGNFLSVLSPYRVAAGSLKPTRLPARAMLAIVATQLLFPIAFFPALIPSVAQLAWSKFGGSPRLPIGLFLAMPIAAATLAAYAWSLAPLGRFLQRRETLVLAQVTAEVE
jgi:hypothetical protein